MPHTPPIQESSWISIKSGVMPKAKKGELFREVIIAEKVKGKWFVYSDCWWPRLKKWGMQESNPTHWQYLPEPPKTKL